jgi:hypothetical protein
LGIRDNKYKVVVYDPNMAFSLTRFTYLYYFTRSRGITPSFRLIKEYS